MLVNGHSVIMNSNGVILNTFGRSGAGAGDYDPAEDGPPGASGGGGGAGGGVQGPGNDDLLALLQVIFIRIWNPEGPSMKFALVGPFMLSQALVLCLELHVYP